jgi:hypothetical protein
MKTLSDSRNEQCNPEKNDETIVYRGVTYRVADLPPRLASLLITKKNLLAGEAWSSDWDGDWSSDWSSDWSDNIVKNVIHLGVQTILEPAGVHPTRVKQIYPTPQPIICEGDID